MELLQDLPKSSNQNSSLLLFLHNDSLWIALEIEKTIGSIPRACVHTHSLSHTYAHTLRKA